MSPCAAETSMPLACRTWSWKHEKRCRLDKYLSRLDAKQWKGASSFTLNRCVSTERSVVLFKWFYGSSVESLRFTSPVFEVRTGLVPVYLCIPLYTSFQTIRARRARKRKFYLIIPVKKQLCKLWYLRHLGVVKCFGVSLKDGEVHWANRHA